MRRRLWLEGWLVGLLAFAVAVPWAEAQGKAKLVKMALTTQKVMALTFDDGPNPRYTPKVLELLKRHGARATFFVVGQEVARHPELVRALAAAGMEIGNHGFRHRHLKGLSPAAVEEDVLGGQEAIEAAGGGRPRLYRLPAGVADEVAWEVLARHGYTVVGWSVDARDWRPGTSAEAIEARILRDAGPGRIVILHDGPARRDRTVIAVTRALPKLIAQGYRFVTVSELLHLPR